MICFPNCKINLGLYVTGKRPDGFHNLETAFYPVNWCDALEAIEHPAGQDFELQCSGEPIDAPREKNILYKTWTALKKKRHLPPLLVHLLKKVPMGAGLGGGSADAAFFLRLLDRKFELGLTGDELFELASGLGADCAFFIENKPVIAKGTGNEFTPLRLSLDPYHIAIAFPRLHSSTAEAFAGIRPRPVPIDLADALAQPVEKWRGLIENDFEAPVFKKFPRLPALKNEMYRSGAAYSAMSGSGSAVFGIFSAAPPATLVNDCVVHVQPPASKIL